jgi:hypothetical protein
MPLSSTEQPRPRLVAPYQHCHRTSGDGSHSLQRAPCSRPRPINTPSEKRTMTVKGTSSRSRRSTAQSSTLCRTRIEFISCGRTDGGNQEFRPKRFNLAGADYSWHAGFFGSLPVMRCGICLIKTEALPCRFAGVVAGQTGSANIRSYAVDRACRRNAYVSHKGRTAITAASHAPMFAIDIHAGDLIEVGVTFQ